jgi:hypothetical protein
MTEGPVAGAADSGQGCEGEGGVAWGLARSGTPGGCSSRRRGGSRCSWRRSSHQPAVGW